MPNEDHVDRVRAQWSRERPDLATDAVAVIGRIGRVTRYLERGLDEHFAAYGLSRADWDVLASLRREGPPFELSPTELYRGLMRTSGAMSQRLARLERDGLVARTLHPADRRGVVVTLTEKGRRLVDELAAEHLENERRLLAPLTDEEQEELARLLRKLLLVYEAEPPRRHPKGRGPHRRRT